MCDHQRDIFMDGGDSMRLYSPSLCWLYGLQAIPTGKRCFYSGKGCKTLPRTGRRCSCQSGIPAQWTDNDYYTTRQAPVMPLSPARIAKPKTTIQKDTKKLVSPPKQEELTETGSGAARAKPKRKTQQEFVPMYKVILLGDEEYDQVAVVQALLKVIPKMEQAEARRIFHEAQSTGESIICIVEKEHAEFYAQQLKREEVYVRIEEA
ncbi:ATP-dependent Clp protease adaptor protein ClpS [Galdieria sulphuraria]|uniref:ATP-dependent Clp protease adaptor protein ClpS n=1 Tax=Galdieria sulphuraria TaxID=130081 RepID=M2WV12_GALSU|nr:ATP-dependent Clp protease adaptor protein ClpS [Galdieria sulphuraria]EME27805.1 ATP-dependent Clp protease adaptor protein ClpS [Galdieria sulphuraria]|eukprot:XP_005704325.1 ATP-dependent Clp protease adaptor protein ClpS [Galdieria sulphuraria]